MDAGASPAELSCSKTGHNCSAQVQRPLRDSGVASGLADVILTVNHGGGFLAAFSYSANSVLVHSCISVKTLQSHKMLYKSVTKFFRD